MPLILGNTDLHLEDTNASHVLKIAPGSDLTAARTLTITTGDADRTITLNGSPTLNDWFDQSVKQAASPTFAGLTLSGNITMADSKSIGISGESAERIVFNTEGYVDILGARAGIGIEIPAAKLHVDQSSTTAAIPVLTLDQADVDQALVKIIGSASAFNANYTLVSDSDFGTPGALVGWIQVEVQDDGNRITDGDYYIPIYATPT